MITDPGERYEAALQHLHFEGQLYWQIFGAFLLSNSVFMAFLLQAVLSADLIVAWRPGSFAAGIVGLLICVPWTASQRRSSAYYHLRMVQARAAEPPEYVLLRDVGQRFSRGEEVEVDGTKVKVPWLGQVLRTRRAVPCLTYAFFVVYLIVVVVSGPWW